ncbi:MAG: hypothetical protein U0237_10465 [Thermoleophilia bacterium]
MTAFRTQLASTAASAAGPYGYTISLGSSTALAVRALAGPTLVDALLLMGGAVGAFASLEFFAQRSAEPRVPPMDRPPSVLGNVHVISAGAAIVGCWGLTELPLPSLVVWFLVGFAATTLYFLGTAAQRVLIARFLPASRERAGRRRSYSIRGRRNTG